jgi:hypothetical protein
MAQHSTVKKSELKADARRNRLGSEKEQESDREVVTFTSFDGRILEIPDLPENLGRATALASEKTLSKIWDTPAEEIACQDMLKEM